MSLLSRSLLVTVLLAAPAAVLAHNGATGIVGERMMAMMMLSEQIKSLVPAVEAGDVTQAQVDSAAKMFLMHSGEAMTSLFPEGSIEAPSEASPAIWERWSQFASYADELGDLAVQLQGASLAAPTAVSSQSPATSEPKEWDRLSFASLMGQAPNPLTAKKETRPATSSDRAYVADVVSQITQTCSACHAKFRR